MPDKVWFSTSNWNNKQRPAEGYFSPQEKQAEWDAYNSSKFNGFPFPTIEKNQENQTFDQWDTVTYYTDPVTGRKLPSQFENRLVSVLGDHYSYKFTRDQLFKFFWRLKKSKLVKYRKEYDSEEKTEDETTAARERTFEFTSQGRFGTYSFNRQSVNLLKEDESKLVTELNTNKWEIKTKIVKTPPPNLPNIASFCPQGDCDNYDEETGEWGTGAYVLDTIQPDEEDCIFSVDFTQPVLKTGEDEYRPFFYCNCCNLSPCDERLDCEKLKRFVGIQFEEIKRINDTSDAPPPISGIYAPRKSGCIECCGPEPEAGPGMEYLVEYWQNCIQACNNWYGVEPTKSHARKFKEGYKACKRFIKVIVTKNEDDEIEKTYTPICGATTVSGKSLVDDILKPNVADSLYDVPGCYLFRIDFYGYKAIHGGDPASLSTRPCGGGGGRWYNASNVSWYGWGPGPAWIDSDTAFIIYKATEIKAENLGEFSHTLV